MASPTTSASSLRIPAVSRPRERAQKRTAQTCITCRARKVRCDGRRGICENCNRLGLPCSYDEHVGVEIVSPPPDASGSASVMAISVPRRRARQACAGCHVKKARCSGGWPRCERCRVQGLDCVYRPGRRGLVVPPPAAGSSPEGEGERPAEDEGGHPFASGTTSPTPGSGQGPLRGLPEPDEALALRAFDAFFRYVHHIPVFSFLHRASLMERYNAESLDRSLVLAIVGITALLADLGPTGDDEGHGGRYIEEALSSCLADLDRPSVVRLQALVIAVRHRLLSRRFSAAFMLHGLASRFATALRLNHENTDLCFLARESRRRLMWSLYMVDSAVSGGRADLALWADAERQIHVQLPCNERNFEFDLPETTEPLRPPPPTDASGAVVPMPEALGFIALHVRIHWMRTRILQYTTHAVATAADETVLAGIPGRLAELEAELDAFEARLPLSFRWSEGNLRLRTYSPRLGIYVMTHVWWRQCHLDLNRLFLPGLREALPAATLAMMDPRVVARGRRQCYEHAKAMVDMFAQVLGLGDSRPAADLDLPGCAYQCVRVLYHGLQTGAEPDLGLTRERVRELAGVCLSAAKQANAGPAGVGIRADIERVMAEGLPLSQSLSHLGGQERVRTAGRFDGTAAEVPYLGSYNLTREQAVVSLGLGGDALSGPPQMPFPAAAAPGLALPTTSMAPPAPVAPSHASVGTTGSNAFEGMDMMEGISFGPDLFGLDGWSGLAHTQGWLPMGQFPGQGGGNMGG